MKAFVYLLFGVIGLVTTGEAYKALVVYPLAGKSHSILGNGIVRNLLKDGAKVTYVTAFGYENAPGNLRIIDTSDILKNMPTDLLNLTEMIKGQTFSLSTMITHLPLFVSNVMENENVKNFLNDPNEEFDVVLVEWMFMEVFSGLATVYNCPMVWIFPMDVNSQSVGLVDTPLNPAFSGTVMTTSLPPFTFLERVIELGARFMKKGLDIFFFDGMEKGLYEKYMVPLIKQRGREPPAYEDIKCNASLVLGNSHPSLGVALPLPQNYISIGGYHLDDEIKPLPADLQKLMDDAKHGVIYFSMGSNLKSKDWPKEIKNDLLKMFGTLKQTVLWKFEEKMENTPKNVHILEWAPQQSILAHPNIAVFVTHGGMLSTTETISHGVPLVGVPVFGDQYTNVKRAVARGFAQEVKLSYDLAADLKIAIEEVLSNPSYRQKVKELSFIYHDRPVKPGVEIAHWVRHVIQTRGAPHLRSPSAGVPLYQQLYLDLAAVLIVLSLLGLYVLKRIRTLICPNKTNKQKKH